MSKRSKWIGIALVLLGIAWGSQYVRATIGAHASSSAATAAASISPEEITRTAGALPVTVVESYF